MDYDSIELPIVFDKLNQSQPFLFIKKIQKEHSLI